MQIDLNKPIAAIQDISCPTCDQTFLNDIHRWLHQISHGHFNDTYTQRPTFIQVLPNLPGVYICVECGVYYRRKETALNTDPHTDDPVWLKRQHLRSDWIDPVIEHVQHTIYDEEYSL